MAGPLPIQDKATSGGGKTHTNEQDKPHSGGSHTLKAVIIIPARYQSTRLPGKMLLNETGKYLVQHVYERALKASLAGEVVIATDDERILSAATEFGAQAALTGGHHRTGTERVAEAAAGLDADVVVNVQGDEPLIDPELIDSLIGVLIEQPQVKVATAAYVLSEPGRAADPNLVKVVVDREGNALYFSRSPIPYLRDERSNYSYLAHVGIYAYRRDFLLELTGMEQTELEVAEKLEQLRVLENGHAMKVILAGRAYAGIDTPEDYRKFVEEWKKSRHQG